MASKPIIKFECRMCKKKTEQIERIITDNLPHNVKTLQCRKCATISVCLMEGDIDAVLGIKGEVK